MSFGPSAAERLAKKTILITGASSGIGQAVANEYAEAANGQLKLVLAARRLERLQEVAKELQSKFPAIQVFTKALDISKTETIEPFLESLPREFSDIDVLVNNAGKALGTDKVGSIPDDDIKEMFDTNVLGMIKLTQAILPKFKAKNSGDIVQLGSIAGRDPYPGGGIYCATKAALKFFTESLRKELIDTAIRVIEVDPGAVETEFSLVRYKGDAESAKNVYAGYEPLTAKDIAEVIVFASTRRSNVVIADSLVFPTNQASSTHRYRK